MSRILFFDIAHEVAEKLKNFLHDEGIEFDAFSIDTKKRAFRGCLGRIIEERNVSLTKAETDLLSLLVEKSPSPVSREQIFKLLKGVEWSVFDRSIDILISRLREKLGDNPKKPRFIHTVRSLGYRFLVGPLNPS